MSHNPDHLETLIAVPNEIQAVMIVAALKEGGIDAVAEGGLTAGFRAEAPGLVNVMVRQADADRARVILAEYNQAIGAVDWDQVDLGELE